MKLLSEEKEKKLIEMVSNPMQVPFVKKVCLNMGLGEAVSNKNCVQHAQEQLSVIAGQKAVVTKARRSISAFKIRQGLPIGVKVTLRGRKMVDFINRLICFVLPRQRDFKGIPVSSVDQNGNMHIGLSEQTIFPEIEFDKVDRIRGLQITFVTGNISSSEEGVKFFELVGVPFNKG